MLDVRDEALVVMQRSAEGSEGASEVELEEEEGRGAPFYVRRRHDTTRHGAGALAGPLSMSGSREVVKRPSKSHAPPAFGAPARAWRLAWRLTREQPWTGAKPERGQRLAKMRLKCDAGAFRIGRIFAVPPLNIKK